MKKIILITFGILIVLGVLGVWVYLFTFGAPKNSAEVFGRFGIGNNANTDVVPVHVTEPITIDVGKGTEEKQKLRQLTTRPVAGAVFVGVEIMYVEQGTGHIYTINLDTGEEKLINGTTIQRSAEAVFSSDGTYVAITSYNTSGNSVVVEKATMEGGEGEGFALPSGASEVAFGTDLKTVLYLLKAEDGATGYSYNIPKGIHTTLFSIPLRDVRILWGTPTYVYTTPTATAIGFIYKIEGNSLAYVTGGGYGLMGIRFVDSIVTTKIADESVQSSIILTKGTGLTFSRPLITEKCVVHIKTLFCAIPDTNLNPRFFPDDWYKGTVSYSDSFWRINESGDGEVLVSFFLESGREVDVSKIGIDDAGKRIYFINKNDNTLWMFDMTEK